MVPSPVDAGHRVFYVCCEVGHLSKDFPLHMIRATSTLVVRGRVTSRGARDRGYGARGVVIGPLKQLLVVGSAMLYKPDLRQRLLMM